MTIALLLLHGLVAVALLGAITHQTVSVSRSQLGRTKALRAAGVNFVGSYVRANEKKFTVATAILFALVVILGGVVYPAYRIDVRIPFEVMGLSWAVGLFEIKEHWGAIGLGMLPLYIHSWLSEDTGSGARLMVTWALALIVWNDFVVGHLLNNIRGLG